jgi:hypothetical protein
MVDNPYLVTFLDERLIFKWCVVSSGSKNGHQKDMWSKEIGLCAQNVRIILSSKVNKIEGTYT